MSVNDTVERHLLHISVNMSFNGIIDTHLYAVLHLFQNVVNHKLTKSKA